MTKPARIQPERIHFGMPSIEALPKLPSAFNAAQHALPRPVRGGVGTVTASLDELPANVLAQATLLNWLGQTPISFHRIYVDITGSVVAGLWLSHAMSLAAQAPADAFDGDDYVFTMSARDCEAVTGITRGQQVSCRKILADLDLLSEEGRQRKTPTYRLRMARIAACLMRESAGLAQALSQSGSPRACTPGPLARNGR